MEAKELQDLPVLTLGRKLREGQPEISVKPLIFIVHFSTIPKR
jgi:hypothetical protein